MHRSRYENGDEQAGQKVSPSVILSGLKMMLAVRNANERTARHGGTLYLFCGYLFAFSQPNKAKMSGKGVVDFIVGSDDEQRQKEESELEISLGCLAVSRRSFVGICHSQHHFQRPSNH